MDKSPKPLAETVKDLKRGGLKRMDAWDFVWIGWILYFAVAEGIALANQKDGDTLSEKVWRAVAHPTFGQFLAFMLTGLLVWLIWHFGTKAKWL